jgi:ribonuclease P protein component
MSEDYQGFRRLRKSWEYQRIKQMGCKYSTSHFVLLVAENVVDTSRLGMTVSRRVGNAVERNRVKRQIREYFRLNRVFFPHINDYSVIAKRGAAQLSSSEIHSQLKKLFLRSAIKT